MNEKFYNSILQWKLSSISLVNVDDSGSVDFLWHHEYWHVSEKYFFFTYWIHISLDHITLLLPVNHSASWYSKLSPEEVSFPWWTAVSRYWVQSSFDMIIQCTSTCNFSMKKQGLRVKGISFLNCLKKAQPWCTHVKLWRGKHQIC